jgi:hypothetical protein
MCQLDNINFDVTPLGEYDIVLGIPWLRYHNPTIEKNLWRPPKHTFSLENYRGKDSKLHLTPFYIEFLTLASFLSGVVAHGEKQGPKGPYVARMGSYR